MSVRRMHNIRPRIRDGGVYERDCGDGRGLLRDPSRIRGLQAHGLLPASPGVVDIDRYLLEPPEWETCELVALQDVVLPVTGDFRKKHGWPVLKVFIRALDDTVGCLAALSRPGQPRR